jgi:hypothetical protein
VLIIAGFAMWKESRRLELLDGFAVVKCRGMYAQAATGADTAVVDQSFPPIRGRGDAIARMRCGTLRKMGRV